MLTVADAIPEVCQVGGGGSLGRDMSEPERGVSGEKETPPLQKKKKLETEVHNQGLWQPQRRGKRAVGQRSKRGLGPSGTPENGHHPLLDSFWAYWSLIQERGTEI